MDRLVFGFAKINFEHNLEDILTENRNSYATKVMATESEFPQSRAVAVDSSSNGSTDLLERNITSAMDGVDADSGSYSACSYSSKPSMSQRLLPSRACKENSLKIKRRSIMKPTKRHSTSIAGDFSMLRPAEIKKIYMNKKITNFRPTNLETIFEEPQTEKPTTSSASAASAVADHSGSDIAVADIIEPSQVSFIGIRKIKRSLSCSDGLKVNKTLTKQRRARVKRVFGRRSLIKKMSLADFLIRLNKNLDDSPVAYAAMQPEIELMSSSSDRTTMATISPESAMDTDVNSVSSKTEMVMEKHIDKSQVPEDNAVKDLLLESDAFTGGDSVSLLGNTGANFSINATLS